MLKSMMRSAKPKKLLTDINVTPLVDVCLVLVIIFMVTATMFLQPPFTVNLPKAHTLEETKEENLFVAVSPSGELAINEEGVDRDHFAETLRVRLAKSKYKLVVIRADENARSGPVLDVMKAVKDAGARRITFGTEVVNE